MAMLLVNHVFSSDLSSSIFEDLRWRLVRNTPADIKLTFSKTRQPGHHIHHYHRPHLESHLADRAITTIHHDPADPHPWLAFEKFAPRYREARVNICLNSQQARFLAERDLTNTVVIPHGYDSAVLTPGAEKHHDGQRKCVLGLISQRYPRRVKGEALLAELTKHLPRDLFSFVFVGEGRHLDLATVHGMGFEATCYEHLPYSLFGELYRGIDLLLILSLNEGGPACLPESLGAATPVAATRVGMVLDTVRDGENGVLLCGTPKVDAARLTALLDDKAAGLNRLFAGCAAGQPGIATWDDILSRIFNLYRDIAGERR